MPSGALGFNSIAFAFDADAAEEVMAHIVAGLFEDQVAAERALEKLRDRGVGALAGAASSMGDETKKEPTARPGGVMVAVNVENVPSAEVVEQMHALGAKLIEVEEGDWRDGAWRDFDPVRPPRHVVSVTGPPNYPT